MHVHCTRGSIILTGEKVKVERVNESWTDESQEQESTAAREWSLHAL